MADSLSYSPPYLPPPHAHAHPSYYQPHLPPSHGHVHVVAPPPRQEPTQRKRPKYTRSKTGCMTCRVKKIKCDETKPNCMRCTHGQRDCTWPEGVPARKKPAARKDTADGRPSTAGSSEASTPPTREPTPPRRLASELNLVPPPQSRRSNEPYLQLHPVPSDPDPSRRQLDRLPPYPLHNSSSNVLPLIPEPQSYGGRYEQAYPNGSHSSHSSRHALPSAYRSVPHSNMSQWNQSPEGIDSSYQYMDRNMVGHGSPNDGHNRYQ